MIVLCIYINFESGSHQSGRAYTVLAHLEVGQGPQVGEENSEHHEAVPDLVAVPAGVVSAGVLALRATHDIYVESPQVGEA